MKHLALRSMVQQNIGSSTGALVVLGGFCVIAAIGCSVEPNRSPREVESPDAGRYVPLLDLSASASSDNGGSVLPTTGTKSCPEVGQCYSACGQQDSACFNSCFSQGSADGKSKMSALEQCDQSAEQGQCKSQCQNQSSQCDACLDQLCSIPYQACYGTGAVPSGGTGTKTCSQIDQCYSSCGQQDETCFNTCFYQGSADGQQKMDALEQCDNAAYGGQCQSQCQSGESQCNACIDQACSVQIKACFG
jgi:hypothetical protein